MPIEDLAHPVYQTFAAQSKKEYNYTARNFGVRIAAIKAYQIEGESFSHDAAVLEDRLRAQEKRAADPLILYNMEQLVKRYEALCKSYMIKIADYEKSKPAPSALKEKLAKSKKDVEKWKLTVEKQNAADQDTNDNFDDTNHQTSDVNLKKFKKEPAARNTKRIELPAKLNIPHLPADTAALIEIQDDAFEQLLYLLELMEQKFKLGSDFYRNLVLIFKDILNKNYTRHILLKNFKNEAFDIIENSLDIQQQLFFDKNKIAQGLLHFDLTKFCQAVDALILLHLSKSSNTAMSTAAKSESQITSEIDVADLPRYINVVEAQIAALLPIVSNFAPKQEPAPLLTPIIGKHKAPTPFKTFTFEEPDANQTIPMLPLQRAEFEDQKLVIQKDIDNITNFLRLKSGQETKPKILKWIQEKYRKVLKNHELVLALFEQLEKLTNDARANQNQTQMSSSSAYLDSLCIKFKVLLDKLLVLERERKTLQKFIKDLISDSTDCDLPQELFYIRDNTIYPTRNMMEWITEHERINNKLDALSSKQQTYQAKVDRQSSTFSILSPVESQRSSMLSTTSPTNQRFSICPAEELTEFLRTFQNTSSDEDDILEDSQKPTHASDNPRLSVYDPNSLAVFVEKKRFAPEDTEIIPPQRNASTSSNRSKTSDHRKMRVVEDLTELLQLNSDPGSLPTPQKKVNLAMQS